MSSAKKGTLYLLPVGLSSPGEEPGAWEHWLPAATREIACRLQHYVVENAKTARASLKALNHPVALRELDIRELPQQLDDAVLDSLLEIALAGQDIGLMSEAGCPAVADPGALLVRAAHRRHIPVKPLVGPSSLLLSLMASGLDGQRFAFHGYLPARDPERSKAIQALEKDSARLRQTQLFIETPYRNGALFQALLKNCQPATRLCVASDLTLPSEEIRTDSIAAWRKAAAPTLDKRPTVFLLLA
ncbi:MAG TPA: SAM-dependent methyltransferase [Rhodocyclaceae bacterium]|nr:SAM-dependent methyltransferase [Rhodocyclaceae bacterium]